MARWRQGTTFQSLTFDKEQWTAREARSWATANGFRGGRTEETAHTITLQQQDPRKFRRTSFRTVQLDDGVQATVAVPVEPAAAPEEQTFGQALAELKAEIKANREFVSKEYREQKRYVQDQIKQKRSDVGKPDPLSDFIRWFTKKR